ncbi:hypothetical protein ARAM_007641 [Aspergillus rambellii]|uniref:Crh-like protein n=1 Tax=Aspergillus rambellii TaxID=308745 RepID=A0A0F8V4Y8_9EURO|nr:hypothetical protein ARAM_007641 [Aspergillus rambellii]
MRLQLQSPTIGLLSCLTVVAAQTYTDCNPLSKTCPADTALGRSASYDFTQGASSDFSEVGSPTYGSDGAAFTVAKQGDAPLIQSKWYIMFGHVEYVIKAAPGTGIVSSAVLQSDDLDEIDWEWLGGNDRYVQTNYFGKGNTASFNRGATHDNPGNHDSFHTYSVDWTSEQIVWQIDGTTVRVLTPSTAESNQYPQTPMMVKVGVWAGGDPDNAQGTIQWAGGVTDYSAGPYTMHLKSLKVTDYSTGNSYEYSNESGSWESIKSNGGEINGNISADTISSVVSVPTITATADSGPIPWSGTHRETSSFVTPSVYPWIPDPSSSSKESPSTSLPDGWKFAGSAKPQPPSRASVSEHCPHSRFMSSSDLVLKRCVFPTQYTALFTSPSFHSSSDSFSPSGLETPFGPSSLTTTRTHSTGHSTMSSKKIESATSNPQSGPPAGAHIAPSINAANSMFKIPLILRAFCALLVGPLVLI